MKALITMSENKDDLKSTNGTVQAINQEFMRSIDAEFENYIPHIIDMTKNVQKFNDEMRLSAL